MLTCATCRFFDGYGECRRHAPVMVALLARTLYPSTDREEMACGDYESAVSRAAIPTGLQHMPTVSADHGEQ